jgi:hypothetical protein
VAQPGFKVSTTGTTSVAVGIPMVNGQSQDLLTLGMVEQLFVDRFAEFLLFLFQLPVKEQTKT